MWNEEKQNGNWRLSCMKKMCLKKWGAKKKIFTNKQRENRTSQKVEWRKWAKTKKI